jgi:hypothetical protein
LQVIDREQCPGELHRSQRSDELLRSVPNGFSGDAGRADFEQAGHDLAARRDTLERLGEAFAFILFRPLAEFFCRVDRILILSVCRGEQHERRDQGGEKFALGRVRRMDMTMTWAVQLVTHRLPRVKESGVNVTQGETGNQIVVGSWLRSFAQNARSG